MPLPYIFIRMYMTRKKKEVTELPISAMEKLAKVMNDSPTIVKMSKTDFPITALKPATQWLIAEEACKILKAEKGNMTDVIKQFSLNIPAVVNVLALAILNDKDRIFKDWKKKEYSEEFDKVCDTIMWETNPDNWMGLLVEVLNMLSMDYFFQVTNAVAMIREMALGRKMKMEEQKSS